MANDIEVCGNCGRMIGNLEKPQIWNEHILCNECKARLSGGVVETSSESRALRALLVVTSIILFFMVAFGSWQIWNSQTWQKADLLAAKRYETAIQMSEKNTEARRKEDALSAWRFSSIHAFEVINHESGGLQETIATKEIADVKAHADACRGYKGSPEWTSLSKATGDLVLMVANHIGANTQAQYGDMREVNRYLGKLSESRENFRKDIDYQLSP